MQTFTRKEVFNALAARYRSYNHGSKEDLTEGLTLDQIEALGHLSLAIKDLENKSTAANAADHFKLQKV